MNNLYKYFIVILVFQLALGQNPSDDIVVSKNDLKQIAESLINVGDFPEIEIYLDFSKSYKELKVSLKGKMNILG